MKKHAPSLSLFKSLYPYNQTSKVYNIVLFYFSFIKKDDAKVV